MPALLDRLDLRLQSDVANDGESRPELWTTGKRGSFQQKKNGTSLPSFHLRLISVTAPPPLLLRLFAVSVGACVHPHCLAPR